MYALAMAMKRKDPAWKSFFSRQITFFTRFTPRGLVLTIYRVGRSLRAWMRTWNSQCEEMLAMFSVHKPSIFVFYGAYPYRGMLNAIKGRVGVKRVWVRRVNEGG